MATNKETMTDELPSTSYYVASVPAASITANKANNVEDGSNVGDSCSSSTANNTSGGGGGGLLPDFFRTVDLEHIPLDQLEELQQHCFSIAKRRRKEEQEDGLDGRCAKRLKQDESDPAVNDVSIVNDASVVSPQTSEACAPIKMSSLFPFPFQPEVLRLIARAGYLRSQDLGRLLLFSSKSILSFLTPNFVYQLIYETRRKDRWSSPSHRDDEWVPGSVVQARGHESVLKSMESLPVVKKKIVALPQVNPKSGLNPDNTVFILSFWILSQKIYSHQLTKEEVCQLTKSGHCHLRVQGSVFSIIKLCFQNDKEFPTRLRHIREKNIAVTKGGAVVETGATASNGAAAAAVSMRATSTTNSADQKNTSCESDPLVVAKIHCIRLDTNQTCTLYHSNLPRFEMQRTHAKSDQINFPVQVALKNTEAGDKLVTQWFHGWPEGIQNFGGLTFSITLKKDIIHIQSLVFGAPGQSDHLKTRHGVSPFHIIEGLAGWQ
jgi:hypothetical protein